MNLRPARWQRDVAAIALFVSGVAACSIFALDDDLIGDPLVDAGAGDAPSVDDATSSPDGATPSADAAEGCQADLASDPANCGACGRSCAGAACSGGVCESTVVATGQTGLGGVAVGSGVVGWTTGTELRIRPLADGGTGVLVNVGNDVLAPELTVAEGFFYVTRISGGSCSIDRYSPVGAFSRPMYDLFPGTIVQVDGAMTFAATTRGVRACDNGQCGGQDTQRLVVLDGDGPFTDLTSFGPRLVWATGTNPGSVRTVLKSASADAGVRATDVATGQASPKGVAMDANGVVWTAYDSGQVLRCALNAAGTCASPPTTLHGGSAADAPGRVVSDGTFVYWIAEGTKRVLRCPALGCAGRAPLVVMSGLEQPRRLALDGSRVIVADWGAAKVLAAPK